MKLKNLIQMNPRQQQLAPILSPQTITITITTIQHTQMITLKKPCQLTTQSPKAVQIQHQTVQTNQ